MPEPLLEREIYRETVVVPQGEWGVVVDDDQTIAGAMKDAIEDSTNLRVLTVFNGDDALGLIQQGRRRGNPPNFVVTDYNMGPGMDGSTLAKMVNPQGPESAGYVPTALVTATPPTLIPEVRNLLERRVVEACQSKPFEVDDFLGMVEELAARSRVLRANNHVIQHP